MLRFFTLTTRKLLVPRPLPVTSNILTSGAASSSSTVIYDVQRNRRVYEHQRSILPLNDPSGHSLLGPNKLINTHEHIRWASGKKDFELPDPNLLMCNMINMLECVDLKDMKDGPPPAFWVALIVGGTQIAIPLLEIIGGYSNVLTIFQLHVAAMTVAGLSGIKWGLALSKSSKLKPNWETMKWVMIPTLIATLGVILPYPLGYLTVGGAMITSLYIDLDSCAFPPWGNANRLFLTLTTLTGLFLALIAYLLFHNRANKKKDKKKKEEPVVAEEEEEEGEVQEDSKPKDGK